MDYGQPVNNVREEPFFTAGDGLHSESTNTDLENSLNSGTYTTDHDLRNIGNMATAASSYDSPSQNITISSEAMPKQQINRVNSNELGQVVNTSVPSGGELERGSSERNQLATTEPFNANAIKTTEKLSPSGIREVDNILLKFREDGNTADFYTAARDMMEKNMENSYGERAAWKGRPHE